MCIIVDACCGHFMKLGNANAKPIHQWITNRNGRIATGGKNLRELIRCGLGTLLVEYRKAGKLCEFAEVRIEAQRKQIDESKIRSNDAHVILLARVSGSRLVYTNDNLLKNDLRNSSLVPKRNNNSVQFYRGSVDRSKLYNCPSCHG